MAQVLQADLEESRNMLIVQRVEYQLAIAARAHHPQAAQQPQLMRDRRLGHLQHSRQIAHA